MNQLPQVKREEWLCVCHLWHPDSMVSHGYYYQKDSRQRRELTYSHP